MTEENNLYTAEHFGITFYEHPIHGEMTPMLVRRGNMFYETELYDPPCSADEAQEIIDEMKQTEGYERLMELMKRELN